MSDSEELELFIYMSTIMTYVSDDLTPHNSTTIYLYRNNEGLWLSSDEPEWRESDVDGEHENEFYAYDNIDLIGSNQFQWVEMNTAYRFELAIDLGMPVKI